MKIIAKIESLKGNGKKSIINNKKLHNFLKRRIKVYK
jgi:hypothetical protein